MRRVITINGDVPQRMDKDRELWRAALRLLGPETWVDLRRQYRLLRGAIYWDAAWDDVFEKAPPAREIRAQLRSVSKAAGRLYDAIGACEPAALGTLSRDGEIENLLMQLSEIRVLKLPEDKGGPTPYHATNRLIRRLAEIWEDEHGEGPPRPSFNNYEEVYYPNDFVELCKAAMNLAGRDSGTSGALAKRIIREVFSGT